MSYGDATVSIAGVAMPRPRSADEDRELVGATIALAGGSERRYDQGERFVTTLSWAKMTEAEVTALKTAAGRGLFSYVHFDGVTRTVRRDGGIRVSPVAATSPVVFDVELTLRAQDPETS